MAFRVVEAAGAEEATAAVKAVVDHLAAAADRNCYCAAAVVVVVDTSFAAGSWDLTAVVEAEHCWAHWLAAALD